MSNCCKTPGESKRQGDRCLCPHCGHEGQPVDRTTIDALLKPESLSQVNGSQYAFCETSSCPVVYYAAEGTQLRKEHVRVRVGLKETEDPIPVCYCFGVTERMLHEEVQQTGRSSASAHIRAEVKAGRCRCEVENPSGLCCLGEVIRAEKQAIADSTGAASPGTSSTSAMAGSSAGGLLAAFLASICCIGPVVFATLGVGVGATGFLANSAGFLKVLLPYRPLFIGLTAVLLGVSFYLAYRKPRVGDVSCQACVPTSGLRPDRWPLWIIAGLAVALVLAPYWLELATGS
jgi:hypothetical protein